MKYDFINQILCGNAANVLQAFPGECIDLTVTSPPYDNLRTYEGFTFSYPQILRELFRVTKPGGVVVWVVNDKKKNFNQTGTSFRQALFAKRIGFNLLDVMLYGKNGLNNTYPARYGQFFDFVFIFSKGRPTTGIKGIFR